MSQTTDVQDSQNIARLISNHFGLMARVRIQLQNMPAGDPAAIRLERLAGRLDRIVTERRRLQKSLHRAINQ